MDSERRYNTALARVRLVAVYVLVLGLVALARPTPRSVYLGAGVAF